MEWIKKIGTILKSRYFNYKKPSNFMKIIKYQNV